MAVPLSAEGLVGRSLEERHCRRHGAENGGWCVCHPTNGQWPGSRGRHQSGDVITGEPVRDARQLAQLIGTMAPGTTVILDLIHDGQQRTVSLALGTLPKLEGGCVLHATSPNLLSRFD
jgi:hypothetical protein